MSEMNGRERFVAVVKDEHVDYIPIFGMPGAPGMSGGCMGKTYDRLLTTGMPDVGGRLTLGRGAVNLDGWRRYWGTAGPVTLDFSLRRGAPGIKEERRVEGEAVIIEDECGGVRREVIDNANTYSMPEFIRYKVRDRESWNIYRDRVTPTSIMPPDEMETNCRRFDDRQEPLAINLGGAYGFLRGAMGPEGLSYAMYDVPELVLEMSDWHVRQSQTFIFPLVERLKPEIIQMSEDLCYNHGMLLSPDHFRTFCGDHYRAVGELARSIGAPLLAVDSDGDVTEFTDLAVEYGVNGLYPFEVKAGNDLFALKRRHPNLVSFGWLEKEVVNEGNEGLIEPEIAGKVPELLKMGRHFPNGDHGLQPLVTFPSLRRFMTRLHDACDNPTGDFRE